MNLNVIWTPEATETFNNNLDYLEKEWSAEVCDQFTERVYKVISKISQNPKLYACVDKNTNLFRSVVTKQISLFYRVKENHVYLISFWNTYQDPEKIPV